MLCSFANLLNSAVTTLCKSPPLFTAAPHINHTKPPFPSDRLRSTQLKTYLEEENGLGRRINKHRTILKLSGGRRSWDELMLRPLCPPPALWRASAQQFSNAGRSINRSFCSTWRAQHVTDKSHFTPGSSMGQTAEQAMQ